MKLCRYVLVVVLICCISSANADLKYTCSWVGNTYGGGQKWVQNFAEGMAVSPDGVVCLASGWDEAGHEFGLYRNGDVIGGAADTHGWGEGGGRAAAFGGKYLFLAKSHGNEGGGLKGVQYPPKGFTWYGISRRTTDGKHAPFTGGKGRNNDLLVLHEAPDKEDGQCAGLICDTEKGLLFVSDTLANRIRVYDMETMKPVRDWECQSPGGIAMDIKGSLWVLSGAPCRAVHFSPEGKAMGAPLVFPATVKAVSLSIDYNDNIIIADGGPLQQVLIYSGIEKPKLTERFGVKNGLWAAPSPGAVGSLRFAGLTGAAKDSRGNLYVSCNTPAGGTVLRSFSPKKLMNWELLGLEFVDVVNVDPRDGTDGVNLYSPEGHYNADWSKPAGKEWKWVGFSLNPFIYPDDMRLHEGGFCVAEATVRHLAGHRFLFMRGMYSNMMPIYRYDTEIAIPSVLISRAPYHDGAWTPPGQPKEGSYIWRDANGDGQMTAKEYTVIGPALGEFWAWWMDDKGGVWFGEQGGKEPIHYLPFIGLDKVGNPVYDGNRQINFEMPAPMNHLLRIEYHPSTDTMFLTGHTTDHPKTGGEWGQVGTEVLRFDGWMKGNRTPKWRINLPYKANTAASAPGVSVTEATIKSFCTAGNALFAVESRTAKVHVYNLSTGDKLGEMTPGPEVGSESGWVDFPDAIHAYQRKNGEYLVFVEEDWKGKSIVYKCKP